jgi:hypothetical protein
MRIQRSGASPRRNQEQAMQRAGKSPVCRCGVGGREDTRPSDLRTAGEWAGMLIDFAGLLAVVVPILFL